MQTEVFGGETGIRTLGRLSSTTVFETVPFDHSGTSPHQWWRVCMEAARLLQGDLVCFPVFGGGDVGSMCGRAAFLTRVDAHGTSWVWAAGISVAR